MIAAALALMVMAKPPSPVADPPSRSAPAQAAPTNAPRLRVIHLDKKKERSVYKVAAAPGVATVIDLPEPWTAPPTCGDCVVGDAKPDGQLWRLELSPDARSLTIRPTRLPGADLPSSAFVTNGDVTLDSGLAITLFVDLSLPEAADARVEFTLSDDEKGAAKLTKRERDLEKDFAERVKTAASEAMLEAGMRGTKCKDFFGGPNRAENVVIRLRQICGNTALVYVTFEVENRRGADVTVRGAVLESKRGAAAAGSNLEKKSLRFNERGLGIAAVAAGESGDDRYRLTVTVDGVDADTNVVIDDIER